MTRAIPSTPAGPWLAALLSGLIAGSPAAAGAAAGESPGLERWLFNAVERTERAIESFERGDVDVALEHLEIALRLAGDDPRARLNAGAGRLAAGRGDARSLLEAVAEAAGGELAPWARYNLGNARMAGGDLAGAIEAYQQALRAEPGHQDAKYNLELARHLLEEQERQESQQEEPPPPPSPPPPELGDSGQQPPPQGGGSDQNRESQEEPRQSPLPQFSDLPDMSAEEAAAILEAVENMEREGRRRRAAEAARQARPGEKDW